MAASRYRHRRKVKHQRSEVRRDRAQAASDGDQRPAAITRAGPQRSTSAPPGTAINPIISVGTATRKPACANDRPRSTVNAGSAGPSPMNPLRRLKAASQASASTDAVPGLTDRPADRCRVPTRCASQPPPPSNDSRRPANAQAKGCGACRAAWCPASVPGRSESPLARKARAPAESRPFPDQRRAGVSSRRCRPEVAGDAGVADGARTALSLPAVFPTSPSSRLAHSGILPCLRGGGDPFGRARARARISQGRVWLGTMTSST